MADETTPAANVGAIDYDKLATAVAGKIGGRLDQLESTLKETQERVTKIATPAPAEKAADTVVEGKEKPLTRSELLALMKEEREQANQSSQQVAARNSYLSEKLKDLPLAYRNQLGNDPAKFAEQEQAIRDAYKADLKSAGIEPKNLGDASKDAGTTPEQLPPVDRSKVSPIDLIKLDAKKA